MGTGRRAQLTQFQVRGSRIELKGDGFQNGRDDSLLACTPKRFFSCLVFDTVPAMLYQLGSGPLEEPDVFTRVIKAYAWTDAEPRHPVP